MYALTVCQPYASLIVGWPNMPAAIAKRVENRTRRFSHRGPLLIHAGKSRDWLNTWSGPPPPRMDFGALLGIAEVVACLSIQRIARIDPAHPFFWIRDHAHTEGPFCLILEQVRRFPFPIPYRGHQGLFQVPDKLIAAADSAAVWLPTPDP